MVPGIKKILEQLEAIIQFVAEQAKDPQRVPKSINYKRVFMMLGTKEQVVTRVTLDFLNSVIPIFEVFAALPDKRASCAHAL